MPNENRSSENLCCRLKVEEVEEIRLKPTTYNILNLQPQVLFVNLIYLGINKL
jgi:hypothetical protein